MYTVIVWKETVSLQNKTDIHDTYKGTTCGWKQASYVAIDHFSLFLQGQLQ